MKNLTVGEVAKRLGVTCESVTKKIRAGKLRAITTPFASRYGYRWLIPASQFTTNGNGGIGVADRLKDAESRIQKIEAFIFGGGAH